MHLMRPWESKERSGYVRTCEQRRIHLWAYLFGSDAYGEKQGNLCVLCGVIFSSHCKMSYKRFSLPSTLPLP